MAVNERFETEHKPRFVSKKTLKKEGKVGIKRIRYWISRTLWRGGDSSKAEPPKLAAPFSLSVFLVGVRAMRMRCSGKLMRRVEFLSGDPPPKIHTPAAIPPAANNARVEGTFL